MSSTNDLQKKIKKNPLDESLRTKLGILYDKEKKIDLAIEKFEAAVNLNPNSFFSVLNLANGYADNNDYDHAIAIYKRALKITPYSIPAELGLVSVLRRSERFDESMELCKSILSRSKNNPDAINALGLNYGDLEDYPKALECFDYIVKAYPSVLEYRLNFAVALKKFDLIGMAIQEFYECDKISPNNLDVLVLLADCYSILQDHQKAIDIYDDLISNHPFKYELFERRAYLLKDADSIDDAIREFSDVLEKSPNRPLALSGLAECLVYKGEFHKAEEFALRAIEKGVGYSTLSQIKKFKADDPVISRLEQIASAKDYRKSSGINYALGKIYDDCGLWEKAFNSYSKANSLDSLLNQHNRRKTALEFDVETYKKEFSADYLVRCELMESDSELPVLIVGMPRSGTTLTEQIVASHPLVSGAGEVNYFIDVQKKSIFSEYGFPEGIRQLNKDVGLQITQGYLDRLNMIVGEKEGISKIVDKMPSNFLMLGLVLALFPKVKVINCLRDPMDNCLSIFFQSFNVDHAYKNDLRGLGTYYLKYRELMDYWHTIFPGRIMDVVYEGLVQDPELWSRRIINHIGLDWDNACLSPHKLDREVKTASVWQVRQPIYKTSVQRWKNYEQFLGPLKEALGYED